jgi:hypothetical protein
MKDDKLIRIPLQFFGEGEENDFDDYYDEVEDLEDDEDIEDAEEEDAAEDGGANDEDEGSKDDGNDGAKNGEGKDGAEEKGDVDELIAELKASGYEGDDIKSILADVKKKRESASDRVAVAERAAANKEGKGHVKSGKPSRSASGDGMAGFSHRDIEEMRAALGPNCTEERARRALEKRIRAQAH